MSRFVSTANGPHFAVSFLHVFQVDTQNRRRLFWQAQTLGWGAIFLVSLVIMNRGGVTVPDSILVGAVRALLGLTISSALLWPVLRWMRRRLPLPLAGWVVLVVWCSVLGWGETDLTRAVIRTLETDLTPLPKYLDVVWVFRGMGYLMWSILYFAILYWRDTQESRVRLAQLQAERRMVELQQLRAQVNPHFLFNAFNSILAEAENPKLVTTLTEGVAEFLRFSLRQADGLHELGEELDALEHYLRVEKVRFEDYFDYAVSATEKARRHRIPGVLVQPLVENAIKYGQRTSAPPLRLRIDATVSGKELVITVANTGQWVAPREGRRDGGIGLANLRRRLELIYGGGARCDCAEAEGWVRVVLRIPAKVQEGIA